MALTINQSKDVVKFLFRFQISTGRRIPAWLWGPAGAGKTECIMQAAEELGEELGYPVACYNLRLATKPDAGDIVGLPYTAEVFVCSECMVADGESKHYSMEELSEHVECHDAGFQEVFMEAQTTWKQHTTVEMRFAWPRDIPRHGPAILFLDEMNRANLSVRDACFTLLENGRAGTHQLPDNVVIVAAGNPPSEEYQVQDYDTERAFMQRAMHIVVRPTHEAYMEYAMTTEHDGDLLKAVAAHPDLMGNNSTDSGFLETLTGSPRSLTRISHLLRFGMRKHFGDGDVFQELISGMIGFKHGQILCASLRDTEQPVPGHAIVKDYEAVRSTILIHSGKVNAKDSRLELLYLTNLGLLTAIADTEVDAGVAKNVARYIVDQPKETAFGFIRMATNRPKEDLAYLNLAKVAMLEKDVLLLMREATKQIAEDA